MSRASFEEVLPAQVMPALGAYRVIDVRQPDEFYAELGHLPGAELVPLDRLDASLPTWDRHRTLLVVCRSGARSASACARLAAAGFDAVHNLSGGMLGWRAAGGASCRDGHRTSEDRCEVSS